MKAEQKELYFYTKDHYIEQLKRISPECVAPLIAVRKVVKKAIDKYCIDYCTNKENPFSPEDFQAVSNKICDEILNREV